MRDHYDVLDVSPDATAEQIKSAYRFQIKAFHPDRFVPGTDHALAAQRSIASVTEAYRVLSDAQHKAEYDRFRRYTSESSRITKPTHSFLSEIRPGWKAAVANTVLLSKRELSIPVRVLVAIAILIMVGAAGWFIRSNDLPRLRTDSLTTPVTVANNPTPRPTIASPTPFLAENTSPMVPDVTPTKAEPQHLESSSDRNATDGQSPSASQTEGREPSDEMDSSDDKLSGPNEKGAWQDLSPDGRLLALSLENADHDGTRVAIFAVGNAIENQIAQYFFAQRSIDHVAWSPDSKFLLFTTTDSGGHSAWHYAAFVFSSLDKSFHKLDEDIGDVVRGKFDFEAPNKAILTVRTEGGDAPSDRDVIVPLDKITLAALPPASNSNIAQHSNFIRNGEFSQGVDFWNVVKQASSIVDPMDSANEVLSVPIIEGIGVLSQDLSIPPQITKLHLSFRAFCSDVSSTRPARIKISFGDGGAGSQLISNALLAKKSGWQSIGVPVIIPPKQTPGAIRIDIVGPNGAVVLFDDFMLKEWTADPRQASKSVGNTRAVLIFKTTVEYPYYARLHGITGSGTYVISVDAAGYVTSVVVGKSSGSKILDNAALHSVRRWRFRPGSPPIVRMPISWSLP